MPLTVDSALNRIIHPKLHRSLQRVYPSWVKVEALTETQGDDFAIVETWTAVPHLAALRGILAAATANEKRTAELTNVRLTHVLDLQSYHPEIAANTHRVTVTRVQGEPGETFNVTGVKHDSQGQSSRLELEKVSY